ncbi:unnamed protein product [Protopolystoma xenopodis]|uniref:Uncharacterized protein n=1 Tax=Protopolystoma xenopodis TaxID=117903 RepID=A0A448WLS1_9PLAT|nr:unnamed protein product [Protopolystoma xenopodis]
MPRFGVCGTAFRHEPASFVDASVAMVGRNDGPLERLLNLPNVVLSGCHVVALTSNSSESVGGEEIRSSLPPEDDGQFLLTSCRLALLQRSCRRCFRRNLRRFR